MTANNVKLSVRDYAVMYYTWQNRLLTTRHYIRKFWPEASFQAASKRLIRLRDAKLLTYSTPRGLADRTIYSSSLAGNRALVAAGILKESLVNDYPRRPEEFTPYMVHDLEVVDLRIGLEASVPESAWTTDHELRLARRQDGSFTRTPDGLFQFQNRGATVDAVVEYERVPYRRTKFELVLRHLKVHYGDRLILFVAKTPNRVETLRRWATEIGHWNDNKDKFLISNFEAVAKRGIHAQFVALK